VAVLIGATEAINLNSRFVNGVYGDEDLSEQLKELKNKHAEDVLLQTSASVSAMAAAKAGSGVRARWIELPDCQDHVAWDDTDGNFDPNLAGTSETIPLKADLSNAIIATCKGPHAPRMTPEDPEPITGPNEPEERSQIYDPVWKSHFNIPDHEHQVQQLQHGHVDRTDETVGPMGDFYQKWNYKQTGAPNQPFQEANGTPWNHEGPGGINYTVEAMPTNYNNSIEATAGTVLPRNTGTPQDRAAGGVAHVTPTGIAWGDGTHFVQPTEGVFNATTGMFIDYAAPTGPAAAVAPTLTPRVYPAAVQSAEVGAYRQPLPSPV
jgi:hypothetical protein